MVSEPLTTGKVLVLAPGAGEEIPGGMFVVGETTERETTLHPASLDESGMLLVRSRAAPLVLPTPRVALLFERGD